MKKHSRSYVSLIFHVSVSLLFGTGILWSQLPPDVAKYGYADTIFVNGKVVSMDDISNSTSPGNIYQGIAVKHDKIMKLGMGHPMGPLKLADLIGVDVCVYIMNVLYDGFKNEKYKPSSLLVEMVSNNKLGKKTGEGFYKYEI